MTGAASGSPSARLGSWVAALSAVTAAVALGVGVSTPPRSGPYCLSDCIGYPYTDAAAFVPRDYLWMYPALVLSLLFVLLVACTHASASPERRLFGLIALLFATASAGVLVTDYVLQLVVMQPSLLKGEAEQLVLLSQYNPHGVFIGLEDTGYLLMGLALGIVAPALPGGTRLARATRYLFGIAGGLAAVSLPVLALIYGADLDYRYEVVGLGIDWLALIVGGALLTIVFRRSASA